MQPIKVAIIGMGPRGLTVLERMLEHAHALPDGTQLDVMIFDPGAFGEGVHDSRQPDHLLINTVSSQVTMFAPSSVAGDGNELSLVQWARREGYRRLGGLYCRAGDTIGAAITDSDHLPRNMLGEYLAWFYKHLARRMPPHIKLKPTRCNVLDIIPNSDGYELLLDTEHVCHVHYAVIATGHGNRAPNANDRAYSNFVLEHVNRNARLDYFPTPYPVHQLDAIDSKATVAIQGFGLTAHDVISSLTLGRGGRYTEQHGQLRYVPSGDEPKLLLFSRNCLPFAARGINQKGLIGIHSSRFFTPAAVIAQRNRVLTETGSGQLDFIRDVLPLIIKEMAYAYRSAAVGAAVDAASFVPCKDELDAINKILWPLEGKTFASQKDFALFFDALVRDDLKHALRGNIGSPVKAATDVLRDTRAALRIAVEHSGLTPDSHRYFVEQFNAITNRISFGPPNQRNFEYLALREAQVIDIAGGPGVQMVTDSERSQFRIETPYPRGIETRLADVLIIARLDSYSPLNDGSRLTKNLLSRGLIRPYRNGDYHPGGLDIDNHLHPINAHALPESRLWALGYPVEGQHFYTHALPRPAIESRQTADAQTCVSGIWDGISQRALGSSPVAANVESSSFTAMLSRSDS